MVVFIPLVALCMNNVVLSIGAWYNEMDNKRGIYDETIHKGRFRSKENV